MCMNIHISTNNDYKMMPSRNIHIHIIRLSALNEEDDELSSRVAVKLSRASLIIVMYEPTQLFQLVSRDFRLCSLSHRKHCDSNVVLAEMKDINLVNFHSEPVLIVITILRT